MTDVYGSHAVSKGPLFHLYETRQLWICLTQGVSQHKKLLESA